MFYGGFAIVAVGIALTLASYYAIFFILGLIVGAIVSTIGYVIHKYGKFKENTEQIASGVTQGIHGANGESRSHLVPLPSTNICPTCHHPLSFIEEYQAWYCFNCKDYR